MRTRDTPAMKLRELLCALCLSCLTARAIAGNDANDRLTDVQDVTTGNESVEEYIDVQEKLRDKRALNLILSGLAQVFGYTVSPVQFTSLSNPNTDGSGPVVASSNTQQSSNSSSAPQRPRETIRFTGVVNFGNNSDVLGHLQQYERLFHGNVTSTTSEPVVAPNVPSVSPETSTILPEQFVLKIPIPIAPPVSTESPFSDLRKNTEKVNKKKENIETHSTEDKKIFDEKEGTLPGSRLKFLDDEPYWKKDHEERIAELERKQKEYAQKLREHEESRREYDSEEEYSEHCRNRGRSRGPSRQGSKNKHKSAFREETDSRERGESGEQFDTDRKFQEKTKLDSSEKLLPKIVSNYTNLNYDQPLPIRNYYETDHSDELRDSYGEILPNGGLIDQRIANYLASHKEPPPSKDREDRKESRDRFKEEYSLLPENKYEEYDIDDTEKHPKKKSEKGKNTVTTQSPEVFYATYPDQDKYVRYEQDFKTAPKEDIPKVTTKPEKFSSHYSYKAYSNVKDPSPTLVSVTEEPYRELEITQRTPFIVPVTYIYTPDRFETSTKSPVYEKPSKYGSLASAQQTLGHEEPKKEEPKPLPEKSKKLHEGEGKHVQIWPAPFDYVFDSTEQTNVVIPPGPQKFEYQVPPKTSQETAKEINAYFPVPVENIYPYPEGLPYYEHPAPLSYQQAPIYPVNPGNGNYSTASKKKQESHPRQSQQPHQSGPGFADRYRYVFEGPRGLNESPPSAPYYPPQLHIASIQDVSPQHGGNAYHGNFQHTRHSALHADPNMGHYYYPGNLAEAVRNIEILPSKTIQIRT